MKPYELKQGILDKMENEVLIEKIMKLQKVIEDLESEIRYIKIKNISNERDTSND
jgi:hypothetical protein